MAATTATKRRPRNSAAASYTTETFTKDAVLLRTDIEDDVVKVALDELFEAEGITTFEAKAKALNYPSTGMLHRAYKGGAVSSTLICAIRRWRPAVPYEQLFVEGHAQGERKVPADAADLAA